MEQLLRDGLSTLGLPEDGIPALLRYAELLVEKNKVMNLTAITEPADIAALHFLDSAALLALADLRGKRWWMWAPARVFRECRCAFWSRPST